LNEKYGDFSVTISGRDFTWSSSLPLVVQLGAAWFSLVLYTEGLKTPVIFAMMLNAMLLVLHACFHVDPIKPEKLENPSPPMPNSWSLKTMLDDIVL